jgi:glycosyltransferase involved in cell wall biosynthesis
VRLTVLTPYLPYPGVPHAGGTFLYEYLQRMRDHARVRLIAPALDDNLAALSRARDAGLDVRLVSLDSRARPLRRRAVDRAATLLSGFALEAQVERSFRRGAPWSELAGSDVVEIQWSQFLPFVPDVRRAAPRTPISVMVHDVTTQMLARRAAEAPQRRERRYARVMAARARRREPRLLNRGDVAWTFSDWDRSVLRTLGVCVPVHVVEPPLVVPARPPGTASEPCVLFTGYLRRAPNHESLLWFLDEVWPLVVARVPAARFVAAGADPPAALRARASPSVRITGYVEDLDPFYRSARAFVAPLRSGAGLKFKVPQAMLYGLPVVATPVAAEGVIDRSGPDAFAAVTDDPKAMAAALADLIVDPDLGRSSGARGRAWALGAHDFSASVDRVLAVYRGLTGDDAEERVSSPTVASLSAERHPIPPRAGDR